MTFFKQQSVKIAVAAALGLFTVGTIAAPAVASSTPSAASQAAQNAFSFSFALNGQQVNSSQQVVETESNEYWFTVNGNQLNKGINIHTAAPGALIKISRQGDSEALDTAELSIVAFQAGAAQEAQQAADQENQGQNLIKNLVNEQELTAAGIFSHTTAIQLSAAAKSGTFKLGYGQPLAAKGQYVVHVKEKQAAQKLKISAQKQHFVAGEDFSFAATMINDVDSLNFSHVNAYIKTPSGKQLAAKVNVINGVAKVSAADLAIDADNIEAPRNGLYELYIDGQANDNGQIVRRTGKIAFGLAPHTANLGQVMSLGINPAKPQANFAVDVKTAGRFEVRAVLYGHDNQGKLTAIMETHAAKDLTEGQQIINMAFDQKILAASGLKAPFVVQNTRLFDQTRMSRL